MSCPKSTPPWPEHNGSGLLTVETGESTVETPEGWTPIEAASGTVVFTIGPSDPNALCSRCGKPRADRHTSFGECLTPSSPA